MSVHIDELNPETRARVLKQIGETEPQMPSTAIVPVATKTYTPAEMRARSILSRMDSLSAKLKTLEADIRLLWIDFDNLKLGETILGCATKKDFCENRLNRTPRAIQYMLTGGNPDNAKRSEIISPPSSPIRYALTNRQQKIHRQEFRMAHPEHANLSNDEVEVLMYPPEPAPKEISLEDALAKVMEKTGATYQQVHEIAKQCVQKLSEPTENPDADIEGAVLNLPDTPELDKAVEHPIEHPPINKFQPAKTSAKVESRLKKVQREFASIKNPSIGHITVTASNVSSDVETASGRYDLLLSGVSPQMLDKIRKLLS